MGHDGRCSGCGEYDFGEYICTCPRTNKLKVATPSLEKRYKKRYNYLLKELKHFQNNTKYFGTDWVEFHRLVDIILKDVKKIK